ncbi:putative Retrovirus-related Pol polyprotein [Hypsibius exemplaris]|uniref:Retrovirus-related Pol polyprotein n=1 Tax=Hypsibius exemplaris TaxID=2072580 RepID=A0A1W0WM71_HYPEX|nr:putative Retrovirus-related Pol polyprotein [Hypsibius exemplaris]
MPDQTPAINLDAKQLAKEVTSLAVVNDVRPPLFSGKAGEDVTAWVRRFETVAKALEWDSTRQLSQVGVYLSLFAASWYAKETRDGTAAFATWTLFSAAIIKRFEARDYKAQIKREAKQSKNGQRRTGGGLLQRRPHFVSQGNFREKSTEATLPAPTEVIVSADTVAAAGGHSGGGFGPGGNGGGPNYNRGNGRNNGGYGNQGSGTAGQGNAPSSMGNGNRSGQGGTSPSVRTGGSFQRGGGGSSRDRPPVTCYICGGPHIQRHCPENQTEEGRGGGNHQMRGLVAQIPETAGAEDSTAEEPVRVLHMLYSDGVDDRSVPGVGGSVDCSDTTDSESSEEEAGSGFATEEGGSDRSSESDSSEGGIEIVCEADVGKMPLPESPKLTADYYYGEYSPESPPELEARGLVTTSEETSTYNPPGGVNVTTESLEIIEEVESIPITAATEDVTDGTNLATLGGKDPIAITRNVPVINLKLNGMEATALLDTGASFFVVNISFVRGLGVTIRPYNMEAQLADNRTVRTDGIGGVTFGGSWSFRVAAQEQMFQPIPQYSVCAPPLKSFGMKLLQQQCGGDPVRRQQLLHMATQEKSDLDLSGWDYSWSEVPVDTFDFCDELTADGRKAVRALLVKYGALFHTDGREMGGAKVEPFRITLEPGTKPIFRNQYRRPPKDQEEVMRQTKDMLAKKVIRPSRSPWGSPVHLAPKGNGKRMCADMRAVNAKTIPDRHPLPHLDDCLQTLAGARYFSTMDLQSGFWQCPLDEESKPITAFQAGNEFYEYNVLLFGLRNAPSYFQRMMS